MPKFGMSSSCFYPSEMLQSFENIALSGIKTCEVFINAKSEFKKDFIEKLNEKKEANGIDIVSVHPYTSFAENTMLFSSYKQRFFDFLEDDIKLHFEAANLLGAKFYVVHGIRENGSISDEEYFERFSCLIELSKKFGLLAVQENVVQHASQDPDFLLKMKNYIGNDFRMVLDIKQAKRAGFSAFDFIEKLGSIISHIHISDYNTEKDCILPLTGVFDFKKLFGEMEKYNYDGCYIIELYQNGYKTIDEIINSKTKLEEIYEKR